MMAGSSDGGAHVLSFCGADFTTRLLTEWVPDVLSFEAAVGPAHEHPRRGLWPRTVGACSPSARRPTST